VTVGGGHEANDAFDFASGRNLCLACPHEQGTIPASGFFAAAGRTAKTLEKFC
jgi:hypothetical protein